MHLLLEPTRSRGLFHSSFLQESVVKREFVVTYQKTYKEMWSITVACRPFLGF